jgi:K+-sensing histidine kinase KdpD
VGSRANGRALTERRQAEQWLAFVRLGGVLFAVLEVGIFSTGYPTGYERAAWIITAVFGAGSVVIASAARRASDRALVPLGFAALSFDLAVITSFAILYSYEYGSPTRWALMFVVIEAALRYGLVGSVAVSILLLPILAFAEWWRADRFGPPDFQSDRVSFPFGVMLLSGVIVGWLVNRLRSEMAIAESRLQEAEGLRDALGHRVDILEAANRCARALGSSLEVDEAFNAFIREVRGLVPFDRIAVVLVEGDRLQVLATAGKGADDVFPPGSARPLTGSIYETVATGQTVYRRDMRDGRYPEEAELLELGLRSRLTAPLLVGMHPIGLISFSRGEADAFSAEEVELVSLIGRLAATAVQNIRSYDAERHTVEELRRLSALRADFVSLVSHELRSPMAAVIGSARTLQQRWRELSPEQRESFLALIADETNRLASLIGDVLDTSRIDAGTFSYAFDNLDISEIVQESVASAMVGQDEVRVAATVHQPLPPVRGDRERLRQVLANLIDNATKFSSAGASVDVTAQAVGDRVLVAVRDAGPGIPREEHGLIFEKFGRARGGSARPGTGLGLFIARSIVEAHGGTLDVHSVPGQGATFTISLPAG